MHQWTETRLILDCRDWNHQMSEIQPIKCKEDSNSLKSQEVSFSSFFQAEHLLA